MLWFDQDKISVDKRILRAADFYTKKYNILPNVCYCHDSDIPKNRVLTLLLYNNKEIKVQLIRSKSIRPNHFWIGNEANGKGKALNVTR